MGDTEYYLDTSIWIDFYEKRGEHGEAARQFLLHAVEHDVAIAYSDLHIQELKNLGYTLAELRSMFSIIKHKNIKHIHISKTQLEKARIIARQRDVPRKDVLHAILAGDNNLQLVARDHHFGKLGDITKPKKPEDVTP